jgi:hypothetical protein
MNGFECAYNIIELSGTLTANRTFNFYLDTTRLYGRKAYKVLVSAISNSTTTRIITLSGAGSIDVTIPVKSDSLPQIHEIYIDASGNIKAGLEGYTIIEEGTNSNGSWIKFSNGWKIAYIVKAFTMQQGTVAHTFPLPIDFTSTVTEAPVFSTVPAMHWSYIPKGIQYGLSDCSVIYSNDNVAQEAQIQILVIGK